MSYFRSTIVIYSEFDPATVELADLAREATDGSAICTESASVHVAADDLPEAAATFFADDAP